MADLGDNMTSPMQKATNWGKIIEGNTPKTQHGHGLVGWALYEVDGTQSGLFALNAYQAAKFLHGETGRTITPVYSDTWFYGTDNPDYQK